MPRASAGPRLWFDKQRDTWKIIDAKRHVRTGCAKAESKEAERALADYIAGKHRVEDSPEPPVADILSAYLIEHVPHTGGDDIEGAADNAAVRVANLEGFWGNKLLKDITANNCRAYVVHRTEANLERAVQTELRLAAKLNRPADVEGAKAKASKGLGGSRRDLELLRAAINFWHREHGPLKHIPAVTLPQKAQAKDVFLTRSQCAKLIWSNRRVKHFVRFAIIGWYTGSRPGVIRKQTYDMFDLQNQSMVRKRRDATETKKRAPRARISSRLCTHLRRWQRLDDGVSVHPVHIEGRPVAKLRRSWDTAVRKAGLDKEITSGKITPHSLRHSRATNLMKNGADEWAASQNIGMSPETLRRVYGHHHPDWQKDVAEVR